MIEVGTLPLRYLGFVPATAAASASAAVPPAAVSSPGTTACRTTWTADAAAEGKINYSIIN